jgi:hypothetical protein
VELYLLSSNMPSWRGAQLKNKAQRDKFTFTFLPLPRTVFTNVHKIFELFALLPSLLSKSCEEDQIKDEMGGMCNIHEEDEKCIQNVSEIQDRKAQENQT